MPVNEPTGEPDHGLRGGCAPGPLLSQSRRLLGAVSINIAPARLSRAQTKRQNSRKTLRLCILSVPAAMHLSQELVLVVTTVVT